MVSNTIDRAMKTVTDTVHYDLHIERIVTVDELCAVLAQLFGAEPERIKISRDQREEIPRTDLDTLDLKCYLRQADRGFRSTIWVIRMRDTLAAPTELELARGITKALFTTCLIGDDTVNPYSWIQVLPDGTSRLIQAREPRWLKPTRAHRICLARRTLRCLRRRTWDT